MPPENPLKEEQQPYEQIESDNVINIKTIKKIAIPNKDGTFRYLTISEHKSAPNKKGIYKETETYHLQTDTSGQILPNDPQVIIAYSHSGCIITSPEQMVMCTSKLHPRKMSKIIKLQNDGRATGENQAICSYCDSFMTSIYIGIGIIIVGVIFGIWAGAGIF